MLIFGILAAILTLAMFLNGNAIVSLMQTPSEAIQETETYIHYCSLGIPFIAFFNMSAGIMRGLGSSKTPMKIVGISGLCNVFGDLLLTGIFHLDVAGVAIATAFSQAVSAVLCAVALSHSKSDTISFSFSPDRSCVKSIFSVGLPIAMQDTLINISFMILTLVANQRGLESSSAVGIVEKLITFMFLVPSSMLSSVSAFTAQNSGAHKEDRIHECVIFAIAVTAGFGLLMCIISWAIPDTLASIFTKDSAVIKYAGEYLRSYSIDCILVGFTFVINGYLTGTNRSLITFIHNTLAIFAVRIPAAFLLSSVFPDTMFPMGFASPLGSIFSIIFLTIYFLQKKQSKA
jgi:putative MATE family efflux protein